MAMGTDCLTPSETTAMMLAVGVQKVKQPYYITFFKAFMGGWMVCFGALVVQIIQGGSGSLRTDYPSLIGLVSAFFFPIGLIMLVLTGQELVTANFMILVMTSIKRRTKLWELPLNWFIVFFGNLAGSLCTVAFMAHYSDLYKTDTIIAYSQKTAMAKVTMGWGPCVLRGIGCNFLVCMGVWLGSGARETVSKFFALHYPVFIFVFLGYEHVVVNMYYVPIGMVNGASVSVGKYIAQSIIPSFIGNVIGGCLLGVPMLFFHEPLELPFFNGSKSSVVVRRNVDTGPSGLGDNLPEEHSSQSSQMAKKEPPV